MWSLALAGDYILPVFLIGFIVVAGFFAAFAVVATSRKSSQQINQHFDDDCGCGN